MIRVSALVFAAIICIGCANKNRITIYNCAQEEIMFNFRADVHSVQGGGRTVVIDDIPDGTYTFGTTYEVPAGASSFEADKSCSGTLTFSNRKTKIHFTYSSVFTEGKYTLGAVWTSTDITSGAGDIVSE